MNNLCESSLSTLWKLIWDFLTLEFMKIYSNMKKTCGFNGIMYRKTILYSVPRYLRFTFCLIRWIIIYTSEFKPYSFKSMKTPKTPPLKRSLEKWGTRNGNICQVMSSSQADNSEITLYQVLDLGHVLAYYNLKYTHNTWYFHFKAGVSSVPISVHVLTQSLQSVCFSPCCLVLSIRNWN